MRNIYPAEVQAYKEDWDALLKPTTARSYALPDWFTTYAAEIGLPAGHPDATLFAAARAASTPA